MTHKISFALALAAQLGAAACLPTPFTFEEPFGVGGSPPTSSGSGGEGGAGGSGGSNNSCEAGSQCEPVPPSGWQGFFVVTIEPFPGSGGVTCPTGVDPFEYFASPSPATCSGCSCQINGTTCAPATLSCYYTNNACTEPATVTLDNAAADCTDFMAVPMGTNTSGSCQMMAESAVVTDGSCSAGTSELLEEDPWGEVVYACPPAPGFAPCGAGQVCAASPAGDSQYLCIAKAGDDPCPMGFANELPAFADGSDTRSCGSCSCGPISCKNGAFEIYDGLDCNVADQPKATLSALGCETLANYFDSETASVKTIPPSPSAQCSGGQATGAVDTTGPMKFCCK